MSRQRVYAGFLRLYPSSSPRDEMLAVLMEHDRPPHRELPALILGGLRARSGGHQSLRERWLYACRAAALLLILVSAAAPLDDLRYSQILLTPLIQATWVAAALAAVAVMAGLRYPALALTLVAVVLGAIDSTIPGTVVGLALAAALLLIPGPRTRVLNPLLLLLAAYAALPLGLAGWADLPLLALTLLWTVIDERVLLAAGLALCVGILQLAVHTVAGQATIDSPRAALITVAVRFAIPLALLALGSVIAARRVRV